MTHGPRVLILGAGLIGAGLAYELTARGAKVSVIEAGLPAGMASGRSFGWINASFSLSQAHFQARYAAMAGHHSWQRGVAKGLYRWQGCLWWEKAGQDFDRTAKDLAQLGYPLQEVDRSKFMQIEPDVVHPPERALLFKAEGAADGTALTQALLRAACEAGAGLWLGCKVEGLTISAGRIVAVETPAGRVAADHVILATGAATPALLAPLGLKFAMQHRPGAIVHSLPMPLRLRHILAAPDQEIRQDVRGCILAPGAAGHQTDASTAHGAPDLMVRDTLARLSAILGQPVRLQSLRLADRPVPGDGLPAVGQVPGIAGLHMAVLHSGVTLAPLVCGSLADQVVGGPAAAAMADFAPARLFTQSQERVAVDSIQMNRPGF